MAEKLRIGVLASGGGTNLQSIIDGCQAGNINAEIVTVISNNPSSGALKRAANAGVMSQCIDHRSFKKRDDFDSEVVSALKESNVQLVVLAGFMRIIGQRFLDAFPSRIMNIHPALLPSFPGLHVQQKALDYGARFTGCTVHFVDGGVDTGPIIAQAVVPVLDNDTDESLSARILVQEHKIYPQAIEWFAQGALSIVGRKVVVSTQSQDPTQELINPPVDNH
ncbi:MAG: phosphoribosylglycinamide formyltransferase [Desulfobacteraceae bacterium 4572_35.2]|nr:MAG: phosphoribosylglycinamide formyltransferase [Desulfobacteraceae bacterium 4572_35.2]